ncbi:hypothetical protein Hanom_Chr05g00446001 [Helianthus anomalus]
MVKILINHDIICKNLYLYIKKTKKERYRRRGWATHNSPEIAGEQPTSSSEASPSRPRVELKTESVKSPQQQHINTSATVVEA